MRLGIIADPHLALERVEDTSWHNPFRLADAHERLDLALAHPLLDRVDALALLGDLAHFGDRTSVRHVVDAVASTDRPAILLSGNHDVLTPGVRLEDEVRARDAGHVLSPLAWAPDAPGVKAFEAAGVGLAVHEVVNLVHGRNQPFDVTGCRLTAPVPNGGLDVWLTHFPVLTLEEQCRAASLLYSAHLDHLAPAPAVMPADSGPVVVLSGHLHVRGVTTAANVLQLAFAALVEPPYEIAIVDVDDASVAYECASVVEPDADTLPILAPPTGRYAFDAASGRWSSWKC